LRGLGSDPCRRVRVRGRRRLALALALLAACGRAPASTSTSDAGLDASRAAASASAAGAGLRVFDPGRAPRARLTFAFVPGREESAELTLDSRIARGDAQLGEERVTLRLGVRYPAADRVELTVVSAETTAATPRLTPALGARMTQQFHPSGEAELPELSFPEGADPQATEYVRGALVQIASNLLAPLPPEPIGEGARWAHQDLRFEVTGRRGAALVVERRSEMRGPRQLAGGETAFVSEAQTHRLELVADGIARRVEAELVADQPMGTVMTTRMGFEVVGGKR
jgi:hypothetical protein